MKLCPWISNTLTAARGVGALRASLSWVFVRGYLPCDDDINEVGSCDSRLSTSPKLLFNTRLWGWRALVLNPHVWALSVSLMRLTPWQRHSAIWWLHRSSLCLLLLLLFRQGGRSPASSRWRHVVIPVVFALLHLGHIHLWSRGCSVHQRGESISCSTVLCTCTLCCYCCRMWPDRKGLTDKYISQMMMFSHLCLTVTIHAYHMMKANLQSTCRDLHEWGDDTLALENAWPLLNHYVLCPQWGRRRVQITLTPWPAWLLRSTWYRKTEPRAWHRVLTGIILVTVRSKTTHHACIHWLGHVLVPAFPALAPDALAPAPSPAALDLAPSPVPSLHWRRRRQQQQGGRNGLKKTDHRQDLYIQKSGDFSWTQALVKKIRDV